MDNLTRINVGEKSDFATSDATPEKINEIFRNLEEKNFKKIMIYFHGGVVPKGKGEAKADFIAQTFFNEELGIFPLSFVWETGILETLESNIKEIEETKLFGKIKRKLLKKIAKKLDKEGRGIGGREITDDAVDEELNKEIPFEDFVITEEDINNLKDEISDEDLLTGEIKAELDREFQGDDELEDIVNNAAAETELLDREKIAEDKEKAERGIFSFMKIAGLLAKVAYKVLKRFVKKRHHGFYPTVIEELLIALYFGKAGKWIWGGMKDKAGEIWEPNPGTQGEKLSVGDYFLDKLNSFVQQYPGTAIDLVGHSAGSIAISHMLNRASSYENIKFRNIIFLAPACRCELFHDEIVKHPDRFSSFRMFTMSKSYEKKDDLVPVLYPQSLLYFISGVLEGKADVEILGLERHITGKDPYDSDMLKVVHDFLYEPGKGRIVFSKTEPGQPDGFRSAAVSHMDFDNDEPTLKSIKHLIEGA